MTAEAETKTHEQSKAIGCWYLTGATCSGKSKSSICLAKELNAEIISMDSMSVYSGMDIGTAKPSAEMQTEIPHYMIDIRQPNESFSVSQFRQRSFELIDEISSRGKKILFVGGTPLYLKTMLRGLFDGPSANWEFRNSIAKELEELEAGELRKRLEQVDPLSAHKLHPNDTRRTIRALEVFYETGEPISHKQIHFDEGTDPAKCKVFAIGRPRPVLHSRIEERVEQMFRDGFVEEVQNLLNKFGEFGKTAGQAVGYQEIVEHLRNERDLESTIERVKVRTRQFARRQETWFRGLKECRWVFVDDKDSAEIISRKILETSNADAGNENAV